MVWLSDSVFSFTSALQDHLCPRTASQRQHPGCVGASGSGTGRCGGQGIGGRQSPPGARHHPRVCPVSCFSFLPPLPVPGPSQASSSMIWVLPGRGLRAPPAPCLSFPPCPVRAMPLLPVESGPPLPFGSPAHLTSFLPCIFHAPGHWLLNTVSCPASVHTPMLTSSAS